MADVTQRRPLSEALADAEALRDLLMPFAERWEVAGSIRRCLRDVGDCDHVVIPKTAPGSGGGLFGGSPEPINLLWRELDRRIELGREQLLDELREAGRLDLSDVNNPPAIAKAVKQTEKGPRTCWGMKQRSLDFRGYTHEIYTAEPETWGLHLLIRTGPSDFSRHVVTLLRDRGTPARDGRVVRTVSAGSGGYGGVVEVEAPSFESVPTPEEQGVFDLAGIAYREPKARNGRW